MSLDEQFRIEDTYPERGRYTVNSQPNLSTCTGLPRIDTPLYPAVNTARDVTRFGGPVFHWLQRCSLNVEATGDYFREEVGYRTDDAASLFLKFNSTCNSGQLIVQEQGLYGHYLNGEILPRYDLGQTLEDSIRLSAFNDASSTFWSKASSESNALAMVAMAEAGKTRRMIMKTARDGAKFTNLFLDKTTAELYKLQKRRHSKSWRAFQHDLHSFINEKYLEFTYGWKPLVHDTKAAAEAVAKVNTNHLYHYVHGSGLETYRSEMSASTQTLGQLVWTNRTNAFIEAKVSIRGVVGLRHNALHASYLDELGIRLTAFLPTVWELIPYSFVIDYFTNTGKLIDSIGSGSVNLRWSSTATIVNHGTEMTGEADVAAMQQRLGSKYRSSGGSAGRCTNSKWYFRRVGIRPNTPDLTFHLPSPRQILNLEALTARFGRLNKALRSVRTMR